MSYAPLHAHPTLEEKQKALAPKFIEPPLSYLKLRMRLQRIDRWGCIAKGQWLPRGQYRGIGHRLYVAVSEDYGGTHDETVEVNRYMPNPCAGRFVCFAKDRAEAKRLVREMVKFNRGIEDVRFVS